MNNSDWNKEDLGELVKLKATGASLTEIGGKLNRSKGSVRYQAFKLGLIKAVAGKIQRMCLRCRKNFFTASPFIRVCPQCKESPEWENDIATIW